MLDELITFGLVKEEKKSSLPVLDFVTLGNSLALLLQEKSQLLLSTSKEHLEFMAFVDENKTVLTAQFLQGFVTRKNALFVNAMLGSDIDNKLLTGALKVFANDFAKKIIDDFKARICVPRSC